MILRIVPIHRRKIGAPPRAAPFGVVPPKRSASAWVWQSESIHLEFTTIFFIIGRSTTRVKWPMIQSHRRYVDPSQEPLSHENQKVSHLPRDHLFDQNLSSSVPYITYDSILSHILSVRPHWPIWTPQKSQLFCEVGGVRQWRSRKIRQGRPGASGVSGQPGGLLRTGGLGWPGWSFFLGNKCYPKKRGWGLLGIMMQLGNAIFGYDIVIIVISVSWFRVTG